MLTLMIEWQKARKVTLKVPAEFVIYLILLLLR
jgi:hypothetical protein